MTYERIKERYLKNYITDSQLERFKALGVITQEQYDELYALKHPAETVADTEANVQVGVITAEQYEQYIGEPHPVTE